MTSEKLEKIKDELGIKSRITQEALCEHIEDDDFFEKYPSPVLVEGEENRNLVLVQWRQYQRVLRQIELAKCMMRPGYNPEKLVTLRISMDEELFSQMELICAQSGMTVAGATEEFLQWAVEHPEELGKMLEEARKSGLLDERQNSPQVTCEWLDSGERSF